MTYLGDTGKIDALVSAATTTELKTALLTRVGETVNHVGNKGSKLWIKAALVNGTLTAAECDADESLAGNRRTIMKYFRGRVGLQRKSVSACGGLKFTAEGDIDVSALANQSPAATKAAKAVEAGLRHQARALSAVRAALSGRTDSSPTWLNPEARDDPCKVALQAKEIQASIQLRADQTTELQQMFMEDSARYRMLGAIDLVETSIYLWAYDEEFELKPKACEALGDGLLSGTALRARHEAVSQAERAITSAHVLLTRCGDEESATRMKGDFAIYREPCVHFLAPVQLAINVIVDAAADGKALPRAVTDDDVLDLVAKNLRSYIKHALGFVESAARVTFVKKQLAALLKELEVIVRQASVARLWKHSDRAEGADARHASRLLHVLVARVHLYMLQAKDPVKPLHFPALGAHSHLDLLQHVVEYFAARTDELVAADATQRALDDRAATSKPKPKAGSSANRVPRAMMQRRAKALNKWNSHKSVQNGTFQRSFPADGAERVRAMLGSNHHSFHNVPTGPAMWSDLRKMKEIFAEWDAYCETAELDPLTALARA